MKGMDNLNSCLAGCARNGIKCGGAEYYAKGWNGAKCYHILTGQGKDKAAKGSPGKRWRDATCYVKG
jgi:hypothetical protein